MKKRKTKVIIVGGGLAGLRAALYLEKHNCEITLLEKRDRIGGRVRTETYKGFTLDEGFQVLLTSYGEILPEWRKALQLRCYRKGARVKISNSWKVIGNPLSDPSILWNLPRGTIQGIYSILKGVYFSHPSGSTEKFLDHLDAPKDWKEAFIKPFMRGVFLDPNLSAAASRFIELMQFFVTGSAALPKKGMQELPKLLKQQLRNTKIRLKHEVLEATEKEVRLATEEQLRADAVILALDLPGLSKLIREIKSKNSFGTTNDYFKIESSFDCSDRYLWLEGDPSSPINHFSFPSAVQKSYSPKGQTLLSTTAIGKDPPSVQEVHDYLSRELSIKPKHLIPLKRYYIQHALPSQEKGPPLKKPIWEGMFIAGEATTPPSINDALRSGVEAAKNLIESLARN